MRWVLPPLCLLLLPACNAIFGLSDYHPGGGEGGIAPAGGAGGEAGQGGGGAPPNCEEGVSEVCYEGPDGTVDVGICVGGTRTCVDDAFGECIGAVVPGFDDCSNAIDEDCDGTPSAACTGAVENSITFPGTLNIALPSTFVTALAVGSDGSVALTGRLAGDLAFGAEMLSGDGDNQPPRESYVVKLDSNLEVVWARAMGPADDLDHHDLAIDADGNVIVVGSYEGTLELDGVTHDAPDDQKQAFMALLGAADGTALWSLSAGGVGEDQAWSVDVGANGTIAVVGMGVVGFDIGGGALGLLAEPSPWLAILDGADGTHVWSHGFLTPGRANSVDVRNGRIAIGGYTTAALDLTDLGGELLDFVDSDDSFVIAMDESLRTVEWAHALTGTDWDRLHDVALTATGNIAVEHEFRIDTTIGSTTYLDEQGDTDVILMLSEAPEPVWGVRLLSTTGVSPNGIATGPGESVVVAGHYVGAMTVEPAPPTADAGDDRSFVFKLDAAGELVWSYVASGSGQNSFEDFAVDPLDRVVLGMRIRNAVGFQGLSWTAGNTHDAAIVRLAP